MFPIHFSKLVLNFVIKNAQLITKLPKSKIPENFSGVTQLKSNINLYGSILALYAYECVWHTILVIMGRIYVQKIPIEL